MFEGIVLDIFGYVIIIGIGGVVSFCTAVYRCVQKQGKRGYRQSQAILILAKNIEEQTKRDHPDYNGGLYKEAEISLKDEKGNL